MGDESSDDSTGPITVGGGDPELDAELSDRLEEFNREATAGTDPARELTVQVRDSSGGLVGGVSGWTWGQAAGIAMVWVRPDHRSDGLGHRLLRDFEDAARGRGCDHVFVTSFTFQAPGFYERQGYHEIFRWQGVPTPAHADVHLRKELSG